MQNYYIFVFFSEATFVFAPEGLKFVNRKKINNEIFNAAKRSVDFDCRPRKICLERSIEDIILY